MFIKEFVRRSLLLLNYLYIYHWVTKQYHVHVALEECYTDFLKLLDKFIECYIGSVFNKDVIDSPLSVQMINSKDEFFKILNDYIVFLKNAQNYGDLSTRKELVAILDEILNVMHKLVYQLNFE